MRRSRSGSWSSVFAAAVGVIACSPFTTAAEATKAPYTAQCTTAKSDCTPVDVLSIAPVAGNEGLLKSLALDFGGWTFPLPLPAATKGPQPAVSYNLAPYFMEWLRKDGPYRDKALATLRGSGTKVLVGVVFEDDKGKYREPLVFDVATLWQQGVLGWDDLGKLCGDEGCKFGSTLSLPAPYLGAWLRATGTDYTKLQLQLDGTRIPLIAAPPDEKGGVLSFKLQRFGDKADNVSAWQPILEAALDNDGRDVVVALVGDKGQVVGGGAMRLTLPMSPHQRLLTVAGIALVLVILLVIVGVKMKWSFLRDDYAVPIDVLAIEKRPFSLGKFQMMFWTLAIAVATIAVLTVFFELPNYNETAIALMGISLGTAVGAVAIVPASVTKLVDTFKADPANSTAKQQLLDKASSAGFFKDVLRDYDSQSTDLHRLQNFILTLVIGSHFVWMTYRGANFPMINTALLAAMGVSGGAFLGFKLAR